MKGSTTKQQAARRRLERVAYHEAGHVVAAYFGQRLSVPKSVSIVPTEHYLGEVEHWPTPSFHPDSSLSGADTIRLFDIIRSLLAGSIAEERFAGRANRRGARTDHTNAVDNAMCAVGSSDAAAALLRWLHLSARDLLNTRWWAVEAIAQQLVVNGTLRGPQIRATILEAMRTQVDQRNATAPKGGQ